MPTVTLNRKVIEKQIGKKLPDEKLKEKISMLGTDLEHMDKNEIHVEIFPSRPDMLSEQGFARAFKSFIGLEKGLKKFQIKKSGEKLIVENSVKDVRPYTACGIIKGLSFDDEKIREVIQIQEKLHIGYGRNRKRVAIGIYPLEKIKFPIYYKALDPRKIKFRPLEYNREIDGIQILSKQPAGREYGHLLEGLAKFPYFIDSNDKVLSMPPIINSHDVGKISEKTTDVFIECSGFDYNVLSKCLNIIVTSLNEMGGTIYSMDLEMYGKKLTSPDLTPTEMKIDTDYTNKRLGLNLKETDIKNNLEKMGHSYSHGNVLIPAYRTDILHMIDLVEDVAIAYGYENFKEEIPDISTVGEEDEFEVFKNKITEILVGSGLIECKHYHISNDMYQNRLMKTSLPLIKLSNALNQEYDSLIAWVTPLLLETLRINRHHEYPQNIFLINSIFKKGSSQTGIIENDRLGVALCGEETDYTRIMQIFDYLMRSIDIKYNIKTVDHPSYVSGRCARIGCNVIFSYLSGLPFS